MNKIALIDTYDDVDFIKIVNESKSMDEIAQKLGYATKSGSNNQRIRQRIDKLNLSTEHFYEGNKRSVKRTEENVFCENSTADQTTLRRWYKKGNYTPYKCSICGMEPIWQGKELTLILDHINGYNKDDRLENLRWVCPNCNQQLDTTGAKNHQWKETYYSHQENTEKIKKKNYCIDCGKEIDAHAIRCVDCYHKTRIIPLEQMPITREELKQLIRTMPFTKIGEKYEVSDNAIRKWCDKFNLPRKVTEIKKYSDEEWEKI